MANAVDNAEVMLSCISLAYKESASELCSVVIMRMMLEYVICMLLHADDPVPSCVQTVDWSSSTDISKMWT